MNYKKIYEQFIADRRLKEAALFASGDYFERHHIISRWQGGTDEAENLIALTAGDHFFAHLLLAKAFGGKHWAGLWALAGLNQKGIRNKDFKWVLRRRKWAATARAEKAKLMSQNNPSHRDDVKEKRRLQFLKNNPMRGIDRTGENNPMFGVKLTGEKNGMHGKKWSVDTRKRIMETRALVNSKEEVKLKRSLASSGENNPRFNPTIYTFEKNDGEIIKCTRFEFSKFLGVKSNHLHYMMNGGSAKGWKVKQTHQR